MGKKSTLIFLDEDPRLTITEAVAKEKELEQCAQGALYIIADIPILMTINGKTETVKPFVELYSALRKNNMSLFKDLAIFQNNDLLFYNGKETELIKLRFEMANNAEINREELSKRFQTIFPTIKLIFKDLIMMWAESENGLKKYLEAFKKHSVDEAKKAIDNYLIAEGLKKAKSTKKPAN